MSVGNDKSRLWQTKLDARLHDPGEKALILMRTREGHEGGTTKALRDVLALDQVDAAAVKRADWWASAADRPQWPRDQWARVHWTRDPVLIHPVSGKEMDLREQGRLKETEPEDIAERSLAHFHQLRKQCDNDPRKTLLAFWRFGPELEEEDDFGKLGALWEQLPADTRIPDHSIWEHLDLTSAFAGAFAADDGGEVALLALSIGPVQPFIASARSTSDLWAGSHLLSRLSWEAMRTVAEELGPDAILFPRLRGIPQVDLWLRDECGLSDELFVNASWKKGGTDANPLFAAALPNRFVALVPAHRAGELAERCGQAAREWLRDLGKKSLDRLLKEAGETQDESFYCYEQMQSQLEGFPEIHWAAVPFSLGRVSKDGKRIEDTEKLSAAMVPFFGTRPDEPAGFMASEAWQALQQEVQIEEGVPFFIPNPGILYPAIYDLAERVLAAAKSVRAFEQVDEQGWRCSLTGETEWLTTDRAQLSIPPGKRKNTLWTKVAEKKPAWARKGEHLGALPAIKRLWPTLFAEEVSAATGQKISRFVVSTHTMALAHQLDQWLGHGGKTTEGFADEAGDARIALPQRLVLAHRDKPALKDAAWLVAVMERAQETEDEARAEQLRRIVRETLKEVDKVQGDFRVEAYYGLLMMDGDRMGRILSGEDEHTPTYRQCFHINVREGFDKHAENNDRLRRYGDQKRAVSPGRHMAISGALNDFSMHVVPHIVQKEYLGRLLYAGGDDVLAMLPVADLLPAAARLRDAWSGVSCRAPKDTGESFRPTLKLEKGYAWLGGRLMRLMGEHASASAGLVVAHHQTPLARVLREARTAEMAAKEEGGRDAFHIRIIKRSGGALYLTLKWEHAGLLEETIEFLRDPNVSRRAVYNTALWLRNLPEPDGEDEMLAKLLAYQFKRQGGKDSEELAGKLASLAAAEKERRNKWLENFLSVAEFLARETRQSAATVTNNTPEKQEAAR